jgi:tetratricopeptide (TPR) repeat protein
MDPDNTSMQRSLLDSNEKIGDLLVGIGYRNAEALAAYREAHDSAKALVAKDPNNIRWQRDLAVSVAHIGDILGGDNKLDEAFAAYLESETTYKAIARKTNAPQESLVLIYYRIGDVLRAQRKLDEALVYYRECLTVAKTLVEKDPNNFDWQRDLSHCNTKISDGLRAQSKLDEALAAMRDARSLSCWKPMMKSSA